MRLSNFSCVREEQMNFNDLAISCRTVTDAVIIDAQFVPLRESLKSMRWPRWPGDSRQDAGAVRSV